MWLTLATAALAAPAGFEAGLTLAVPVGGVGPGPGLHLLGDVEVAPRLSLGAEVAARIPGVAAGDEEGDALAEELRWRTGLAVVAGGPRVAFAFGPADGLHGRAALAGGLAWVSQDTTTQVGRTHDAALTGWICPQIGGLLPLGPGLLTADLRFDVAPADLLVLGPSPGGTAPGIAVGYRLPL
ncbi:MAG: hypothetical protein ACOZNI_23015 [Myxococcota bacterium]